jgi:hypothetical protein
MDKLEGMIHADLEELARRLLDLDEAEGQHPSKAQMELVDNVLNEIMQAVICQYPS